MAKRIRPDDLPILTETVGGEPLELPTLTETFVEQLLDAGQCRKLADVLFPLLEAKLLEAINSTPDWQTAMRRMRSDLPELIRQSVNKPR
ncbi:MAG: hypothetical protein KJ795_05950 [Gammaproteobacteria bacterium]|nr:hypothetical protein [Gammaproteobacteria bacterium]MBU1775452.1 hypothetical protein [Gammaproteobacteria bacterium]MBU1969525.1 hypothetical protein [Gammaproteobacteria bacterium]